MLETFIATLNPMLMLFICMLIGFALNKLKIVPETSHTVMSKLENYVFVPALIISNFMNYCTPSSLASESSLIIYSALILGIGFLISLPLSKAFERKDYYKRNIYKYAITFGNFSFMGNAIVPAILSAIDPAILYKYLIFCLPINILCYSWGIIIMIPKGEKKQSVLKNFINPVFISIIIGIILGLTNAKNYMPPFFPDTLDSLKTCMGPVAMIIAGFVIGGYDIKSLLKDKRIYLMTALRLIVLPILYLALLYFIGAPKTAILLILFAFATPLGLNTVIFPAAYGGDTKTGASMAMISHTLCIITIPLLYAALQTLL